MANLAFPYHLEPAGTTAASSGDAHIRQMLEQLLFTSPGERVNHPDFGCGLLDLVFEPLAARVPGDLTTMVSASVQQWLGDLIALSRLDVTSNESTVSIGVSYVVLADGGPATATFTAGPVP